MVEPYVANVVIGVRISGDAPNNISSVGLQALVFETGCGRLDSCTGYQTIVGWLSGRRLQVATLTSVVRCSVGSNPTPTAKLYLMFWDE